MLASRDVDQCWLGHRRSNPADQQALRRGNVRESLDQTCSDFTRDDIINLANMGYGIFPCCGFEAHWPSGCNKSINTIASANFAIISGFGGCAGDRQIDSAGRPIVGCIYRNIDFFKPVLSSEIADQFCK